MSDRHLLVFLIGAVIGAVIGAPLGQIIYFLVSDWIDRRRYR